MALVGAITVGEYPKAFAESMKNFLMQNSLNLFREQALKRLEQLERDLLGFPELQRIVCLF